MTAYYNDNDPVACFILQWMIDLGVIAPGVVDSRSIKEVTANDLRGFTQCHFFAGGGFWSIACRLGGWHDDRPIWTASCPCQPFSSAGKRAGKDDPRHLWPDLHRLARTARIAGHGPSVIVGEQVTGAAGYDWFDGVRVDLACEGIAARVVDFPSCAVNAPHKRNRLTWAGVSPDAVKPFVRPVASAGEQSLDRADAILHAAWGDVADRASSGRDAGSFAGIRGEAQGERTRHGEPWRFAFAMQDDGWILRQDVIWHKSNPMPESVKDRCTRAHEYVFHFTKSANYFYDAAAVAEPSIYFGKRDSITQKEYHERPDRPTKGVIPGTTKSSFRIIPEFRNKRSVWTVATAGFRGAHFAVYPPDLIVPCILSSSRPRDVVLDPFAGSGTTGLVAKTLRREAVLIEVNPAFRSIINARVEA